MLPPGAGPARGINTSREMLPDRGIACCSEQGTHWITIFGTWLPARKLTYRFEDPRFSVTPMGLFVSMQPGWRWELPSSERDHAPAPSGENEGDDAQAIAPHDLIAEP